MSWHLLVLNVSGLSLQIPLLQRGYPQGTSTVTKLTQASPAHDQDRPVQAQDLASFKSDLATMMRDMTNSSLNEFASQSRSDSGGKEEPSQDKQPSLLREPSQDLEDIPSEGQNTSVEGLSGES